MFPIWEQVFFDKRQGGKGVSPGTKKHETAVRTNRMDIRYLQGYKFVCTDKPVAICGTSLNNQINAYWSKVI